jgi:hypothetical protein
MASLYSLAYDFPCRTSTTCISTTISISNLLSTCGHINFVLLLTFGQDPYHEGTQEVAVRKRLPPMPRDPAID